MNLLAIRGLRAILVSLVWLTIAGAGHADPLPSWNEGSAKSAIIAFVDHVTTFGDANYVPPGARIATFDNDGTLWAEQPIYFQFEFAIDRVKAMAPQHPEWKDQQPYASAISGDLKGLLAAGEKGLAEMMAASHAGMTTGVFDGLVADWLKTARHPRFDRPYTDLTYQPMLELLSYLRDNGFTTFVVSGGGVEFMRSFTGKSYGIPPQQVIGTAGVTTFTLGTDGTPELLREPKILFVDDGPGKAEAIETYIGQRPIFAFGNSDGDQQMLE